MADIEPNNQMQSGASSSPRVSDANKRRRNPRKKPSNKSAEGDKTSGESGKVSGNKSTGNDSNKEPRKARNKEGNKNSNNKKSNRPNTPPKLLEIIKLTKKFKPLTVNGIAVANLSKPYLDYIEDILKASKAPAEEAIFLSFLLQPSDPDFPYEVDVLKLSLCLPLSYPFKTPTPTITVLNDDIPRGFSINIEIGFKQIVAKALKNRLERRQAKSKGKKDEPKKKQEEKPDNEEADEEDEIELTFGNDLLGMFLSLDKYLERFLSMEKKKTIKFVKTIKKQPQPTQEAPTKTPAKLPPVVQNSKIPQHIQEKRDKDIRKFKQRFHSNNVVLFAETANSSVYRFLLPFEEENFVIEMNGADEIEISKLPVKLTIPREYLFNPKKSIRLEIDMSNRANLQLINSIADKNAKLVFGKLLNNMSSNFNYVAMDFAKVNCLIESEDREKEETGNVEDVNKEKKFVSITSQLNIFVGNIEKFLNQSHDFIKWWDAQKEFSAKFNTSR